MCAPDVHNNVFVCTREVFDGSGPPDTHQLVARGVLIGLDVQRNYRRHIGVIIVVAGAETSHSSSYCHRYYIMIIVLEAQKHKSTPFSCRGWQ